MDNAAKQALRESGEPDALVDCLCDLASSLGVSVERRGEIAAELLLRNSGSSVLQSLIKARLSATQVAPVELMRALTEAILEIELLPVEAFETPQQIIDVATAVIAKIADAGPDNRRPVVRPRSPQRRRNLPPLRPATATTANDMRLTSVIVVKNRIAIGENSIAVLRD